MANLLTGLKSTHPAHSILETTECGNLGAMYWWGGGHLAAIFWYRANLKNREYIRGAGEISPVSGVYFPGALY